MRRRLEFIIYFVVIMFMIVRYANVDTKEFRRDASPRPVPEPTAPEPTPFLPDDAELPQQRGSVVIEVGDKLRNSSGTAFAVSGTGVYVTARHVVDGCSEVYFVGPNGRSLERVRSVKSQRNRDFAVIVAEEKGPSHFELVNDPLPRGSEGFMMGYPQGKPADVRATVIGRTEMRSTGRYNMREPVIAWVERERRPGFFGSLGGLSGGPVIDRDGNVVGTAVAEGARRGRVYTTHPRVFDETDLLEASKQGRRVTPRDQINKGNYHSIGEALRASGTIKQVYCRVS